MANYVVNIQWETWLSVQDYCQTLNAASNWLNQEVAEEKVGFIFPVICFS